MGAWGGMRAELGQNGGPAEWECWEEGRYWRSVVWVGVTELGVVELIRAWAE